MNFKEDVLDLLESGIKTKVGGKQAKHIILYSHVDLDGLASAMVAYRQLLKQGFKESQITLKPLQYGQNHPEFMNLKKGQHGVVVDYGDFDEELFKNAGFTISDHHESKGGKSKNAMRHGSERDEKRISQIKDIHRSDTQRLATLHTVNLIDPAFLQDVSRVDSATFDDLADVIDLPINRKNLPNVVNALISKVIKPDIGTGSKGSRSTGAFEWLIKNAKPTTYGLWNALGSEEFKKVAGSEAELAQELKKDPYKRDTNKIKELMGNVSTGTARKVMKGSNSGEISQIEELIRRIEGGEHEAGTSNYDWKIVKELTALGVNNKWNAAYKNAVNAYRLSPNDPRFRKPLVKILKEKISEKSKYEKDNGRTSDKNMIDEKGVKAEVEKTRENEANKIEDSRTAGKTKFAKVSDSVIKADFAKKYDSEEKVDKAGKGQPNRYAGSMLIGKDNKRYPAGIRRWRGMIQFAANPDMDSEDKARINFVEAGKKAVLEAKQEFGSKIKQKINAYFDDIDKIVSLPWKDHDKKAKADAEARSPESASAGSNELKRLMDLRTARKKALSMVDFGFDKIYEQCGGHKPIVTFSNFNLPTLAPEGIRQEVKDLKAIEERIKAMKAAGNDVSRLQEVIEKKKSYPMFVKKMFGDMEDELIDYVEKKMVDYINGLGLKRVDKPINNPERFKGKAATKKEEPKESKKEEAPWERLAREKTIENEKKRRTNGALILSKKLKFMDEVKKNMGR